MNARVSRWRKRQEHVRHLAEHGLAEGPQPAWFLTITQGRCLDPNLRANVWHDLLTSLQQQHPGIAALTIVEWAKARRGLHLHAIICGAPTFSPKWADQTVSRILPGARCHCEAVGPTTDDRHTLASYVAKQLGNPEIMGDWPRYFHPFSTTTNWPNPDDLRKNQPSSE